MSKILKKYKDLLKTNTMTKVQINSMRKALGMCSSLTKEQRVELLDAFYAQVEKRGGIRITAEHTEQGINFLRKAAFTSKGKMRNTKDYPFGDRELDVIRNFKQFRLVNLEPQTNGFGDVMEYLAVWEVRGQPLTSFEYSCGHWGSIQIVG